MRPKTNLYRCKYCGNVQKLKSDKAWIKSICGSSGDKTVHLMKVKK